MYFCLRTGFVYCSRLHIPKVAAFETQAMHGLANMVGSFYHFVSKLNISILIAAGDCMISGRGVRLICTLCAANQPANGDTHDPSGLDFHMATSGSKQSQIFDRCL
jgi:hypothetical protein